MVGRRQTAREPDEMLTAIDLDPPPPRTADIYSKVGRRSAMEIAIVGLAVRLTMDEPGETIEDIRIAAGSVAPVPFRAVEAEGLLKGQAVGADVIKAAGAALVRRASAITDVRGSKEYRVAVLPRVLDRAVRACAARASGAKPEPS